MTKTGYIWVSPLDDAERHYPTSRDGSIVRSHLTWNRAHPDDVVKPGELIHHKNRNRADDRIENLQKLPGHAAHRVDEARRGGGRARGPRPHLQKTRCKRGHRLDDENTYIAPDGSRSCRTCRREKQRHLSPFARANKMISARKRRERLRQDPDWVARERARDRARGKRSAATTMPSSGGA